MDTDPAPPDVTAYLERIGEIPLLTAEQEHELAVRIAEGRCARRRLDASTSLGDDEREHLWSAAASGPRARSDMVSANLRLVVAQAKGFAGPRGPLSDLIQEGNIGLIHAVERFDPGLGFRFSTYATCWIRQSIMEALDQQRTIRLPPKVYRQLAACRDARDELHAALGRRPSTAELAQRTGLDEVLVRRLLRSELPALSLDEPDLASSARAVADHGSDTAAEAGRAVTVQHVAEAVDDLPPIERDVVRMRFGIGGQVSNRAETARALGLGPSAIRRLERRALRRLRGWERLSRLRDPEAG